MGDDNDVAEMDAHKISIVNAEDLQDEIQDETFNLSLLAVSPVDVRVKDLSPEVDTTPPIWKTAPSQLWRRMRGKIPEPRKAVLEGINTSMPSGSLTAIIGSSGSGKTSLLNLMAGRMAAAKTRVAGSTTFNGGADIGHIRSAYRKTL